MCLDHETDSIILPFNEVLTIANKTTEIYLRECPCRSDIQKCPPEEWNVCLIFKQASEKTLAKSTLISTNTAINLLSESHKKNLIHRVFYKKDSMHLTEICNCCFCCCKPNNEIKRNESYDMELKSDKVAFTNYNYCVQCGQCDDFCFFEARKINDGELIFNPRKCFGCGVCINNCPTKAISLVKNKEHGIPIPNIILN